MRQPRARGGAGAGERRVRVAEHDDEVRLLGGEHLADRGSQGRHVGSAEVESVRRLGEAELVDEHLRELGVPVLARVDDDLLQSRLAKGYGERRRLDELGTVPDDRDELHPRASVLAPLRHASAATGASPDDHPKKRRGFSTSISSICCCVMPAANSRGKIRVERCR